jgi:hypothetical protein
MARKSRNSDFDHTLEILRVHSFSVEAFAGVSGGVLVSKHGVAAVLVAASKNAVAFAVGPGVLAGGEVARLVDCGYQKFIRNSQSKYPVSASQLHTIHLFSEELKQLTGAISLYNESLGTTSDLHEYDRLKGCGTVQQVPTRD